MLLGLYVMLQSRWVSLRERIMPEEGAVSTEYALLLVLIALAIIAAATALGVAIAGKFRSASTSLSGP
jgi:Flp pilus assembly pilin Flp